MPECDIAVCTSTTKDEYKKVLTHYRTLGVSVIGAFNFGIGACVSVFDNSSSLPHFIEEKYGNNAVESMLKYTDGYSKFWLISGNSWVEHASKWMEAVNFAPQSVRTQWRQWQHTCLSLLSQETRSRYIPNSISQQ